MKFRKYLLIAAMVTGSFFTIASFAKESQVFDQAGDIAEGLPYDFTQHNGSIASYYKMGTSGTVTFTCVLTGYDPQATLYPGKNFSFENPSAVLESGMNGPYKWTLSDQHEDNGNIKVKLVKGKSVVVQCKEVK